MGGMLIHLDSIAIIIITHTHAHTHTHTHAQALDEIRASTHGYGAVTFSPAEMGSGVGAALVVAAAATRKASLIE